MSILGNDLLLGSGDEGYNLTRSLRFRSSASAYLSRTSGTATNGNKWTWSGWVKRGTLGTVQVFMNGYQDDSNLGNLAFVDDCLQVARIIGGSVLILRKTNAVFRDPSAWYHVVVVFDNANATVANRVQIYVNSVLQTYSTSNDPSTAGMYINANSTAQRIGRSGSLASPFYFDGYMTEVNFIDGQALTPSSFGETDTITGVWKPKRYAGTYNTNGFYLPFTDNSALTTSSNAGLGKDFSGNGNYWTTNNISITAGTTYDSMTDVPTLTSATAANFAVLNPLDSGGVTLSNGNLTYTGSASDVLVRASIFPPTGKWYWEVQANANSLIGTATTSQSNTTYPGAITGSFGYYGTSGQIFVNTLPITTVATYTTTDVIGFALDTTANTCAIYKNNALQTTVTGLINPVPAVGRNGSSGSVNFGQRPFTYTPPTGFVALNTYNLPTSTILQGNKVMDATLFTGAGVAQSIVNAGGFKPDLVWEKNRSNINSWLLYTSSLGVGKYLQTDTSGAEGTLASSLTSFDATGFSLGNAGGAVNATSNLFVAYQWQAGQGTTSSNTSGSITSTVSVNASAGFSVVTYTGTGANATVGHGLGVAPSLIICKSRGASTNWGVWHASLTSYSYFLLLNSTAAQATAANTLQALPTSTLVSLGASSIFNDASTMVMYAWTPIAGYSAFGSYTGNGSSDGTFVYTGFRPKFLMIKVTNAVNAWIIVDSVRNTYNLLDKYLLANTSDAEGTAGVLDLVSNGFKMRNTYNGWNASGENIIYMAFAENPFKNALAR